MDTDNTLNILIIITAIIIIVYSIYGIYTLNKQYNSSYQKQNIQPFRNLRSPV